MSLDITQASEYLSITVGGYLYGTRRGAGFCRVCTAPVEDPFLDCKACYDITDQAVTSSAPLADLVELYYSTRCLTYRVHLLLDMCSADP
jgi:hypothetical protein